MVGLKPFLDYFPPFWFTDLYETLLGHPHLPVHGQFVRAIIGLAVMIFGFIIAMKLSYGRAIRTGVFKRKSRQQEGMRLLESVFNTILLRNTIQRAVFHFFRKTLKSSIFHKMRLASYIAGGLAFVPFLITLKAVKKGPLLNVNMTMLSIPLILSFALLLGLRTVINVPVALEANWVLRLTEKSNILPYFSGFRKALVMLYLVPLFILLFGIYAVIWDPYTSFLHCLYGLSISVLTMEIFFIRSLKIPFTCSYLPGKEKLQLYWFFYAIAFIAYLKIMSWTELELLRSKSGFIYFYAFVLLAIISVRIYQIVFIYKRNGIQYEEEPEPIVLDFDYKTPSHQKENR